MLKAFFTQSQKSQWKETIQSQHCESKFVPGWTDFFSGYLQREPFSIIRHYKVHKPANEALNPSLKDLARQELISFTKHKRPVPAKTLKSSM